MIVNYFYLILKIVFATKHAYIKNKLFFQYILETLRKYPPINFITRECGKEYKLPGTDIVLEKGTQVFIPAYALQRDEKYYEESDKFIPERFIEENSLANNMASRPYIPFGMYTFKAVKK